MSKPPQDGLELNQVQSRPRLGWFRHRRRWGASGLNHRWSTVAAFPSRLPACARGRPPGSLTCPRSGLRSRSTTPRRAPGHHSPDGPARLYVCGITPYDATHIGHAATYVGFDLLNRAWRNAGHDVIYVQNVTDVDDPLLERAAKVNVDWTELAERETELFRQDMAALRVLPPEHFVGAVESIPLAVALIERLQEAGSIYRVEDDLYFSVTADPAFGD